MQINLNTKINQQNPQFKAKFANTIETKRALKQLSEENPRSVYCAIEALKKAMPNDIITVARRGAGYFDIMNKTAREKYGQIFGNKFFQTCTDPKSFVNSVLGLSLTNDKTVQSYLESNTDKFLEKLEKNSQSRETIKEIDIISSQIKRLSTRKEQLKEKDIISSQIEKLNNKKNQLKEQFANQEKEYMKNLIDSM